MRVSNTSVDKITVSKLSTIEMTFVDDMNAYKMTVKKLPVD